MSTAKQTEFAWSLTNACNRALETGTEPKEVAAVLLSFAAGYALSIGWSPELVNNAQGVALGNHIADQKGSSRS